MLENTENFLDDFLRLVAKHSYVYENRRVFPYAWIEVNAFLHCMKEAGVKRKKQRRMIKLLDPKVCTLRFKQGTRSLLKTDDVVLAWNSVNASRDRAAS